VLPMLAMPFKQESRDGWMAEPMQLVGVRGKERRKRSMWKE
jgi:hypothetical protein